MTVGYRLIFSEGPRIFEGIQIIPARDPKQGGEVKG